MGATGFELQRRSAAAARMVETLKGCSKKLLERFIDDFSLGCEADMGSIQARLATRTNYVELEEMAADWVKKNKKAKAEPEPEEEPVEPDGEDEPDTTEPPPAVEASPTPRRGGRRKRS